MRGLHAVVKLAALVAIALAVPALRATAQQTMTFHPLPADSVALLEARAGASGAKEGRIDIDLPSQKPGSRDGVQIHGTTRSGVQIRVDTSGATIRVPGSSASVDVPDAPDAPEPPEAPKPLEPLSGSDSHDNSSNIVRIGSDVTVNAGQVVDGDVVSFGGSVRVNGLVHGSVTSMGGDVTLGPGARVDHDVVCLGGELHEDAASAIGGQRVTGGMPGGRYLLPMLSVVGTGVRVTYQVGVLLGLLVVAFVFAKLAPGRTRAALDMVRDEGAGSFLVGLLLWGLLIPSVIVLALVVIVLCITIIGIPLALAVGLAYGAFLLLACFWGGVVGYMVLGGFLHQRMRNETASLMRAAAWGIVCIHGMRIAGILLHIVPMFGFVGGFLKFIAITLTIVLATVGAGALVRAEYRRRTVQDWWTRSRPGRGGSRADDGFPPPPAPPAPPAPPPVDPGVTASPVL